MLRAIIGAVVGAIIIFMWGFVSWTVIDLYGDVIEPVPNEPALVEQLTRQLDHSGVYVFPMPPEEGAAAPAPSSSAGNGNGDGDGAASAEPAPTPQKLWEQRHRAGPIGTIIYQREGAPPMAPVIFVRGILINFISALIVCVLLLGAGGWSRFYLGRVLFVLFAGFFAAFAVNAVQWNWFYHPDAYAVMMMVDVVIGWGLAGLGIGLIVKPKRKPKPASE